MTSSRSSSCTKPGRGAVSGRRRATRLLVVVVVVAAASLALSGAALACPHVTTPLSKRLDQADAAVVGRVVAVRSGTLKGAPQRYLTFEVDQHVTGRGIGKEVVIRSPSGTDCDLKAPLNTAIGLLLTRTPDGSWVATGVSRVGPGRLVVAGGEPRGGGIKVVVGLVILGLVVLWALVRLKRGTRPHLPGAPRP